MPQELQKPSNATGAFTDALSAVADLHMSQETTDIRRSTPAACALIGKRVVTTGLQVIQQTSLLQEVLVALAASPALRVALPDSRSFVPPPIPSP